MTDEPRLVNDEELVAWSAAFWSFADEGMHRLIATVRAERERADKDAEVAVLASTWRERAERELESERKRAMLQAGRLDAALDSERATVKALREALAKIANHFNLGTDCECPVSSRIARAALHPEGETP